VTSLPRWSWSLSPHWFSTGAYLHVVARDAQPEVHLEPADPDLATDELERALEHLGHGVKARSSWGRTSRTGTVSSRAIAVASIRGRSDARGRTVAASQ
jgi:hypothetical protein